MQLHTPWIRPSLCLTVLCLSAHNSAFAATNPGDQDLIRDRQNRLLEEQQRRLEELKDLPGKALKPTAPATPHPVVPVIRSTQKERFQRPVQVRILRIA